MLNFMTVQAKLAIGFAIGPIIMAVIGWVAYTNTIDLAESRNRQREAYDVLLQVESIATLLVDVEAGQRSYILVGEESFLEPYTEASAAIGKSIEKLVELTADRPRDRARLATLRELIRKRLAFAAQTIALRRTGGFEPALAAIKTGQGRDLTTGIRTILDQTIEEENALLAQQTARADAAKQLTLDSILYGTAGAFALLALLGFFTARSVTVPIRQAVSALSSASAEILAGTTQQAAGMREHSSAVTETVSTVDEVLQTSDQAAQRAVAVSESSQRAADVGQAGRKAVEDSVIAMGTVREQTGSIADSILTLAEQAQAIGEIIAAVNDIGEQINLLSLNAAIEASRAGEHGRGFTVVATEIKTLADQSKKATSQVRQILGEIQKATNAAVMVTEQGSKSVNEAIKTVNEAGTTIRTLADVISEAAQAAAQISASAGQQATGMRQIHQAMQNISQVSAQHLAATNQSEQAAKNLNALGASLRKMVSG